MQRTIRRTAVASAVTAALALTAAPAHAAPSPFGAPPVATSTSYTVAENIRQDVPLVASDPEGGALNYVLKSMPAHGTIGGSGKNLTYTPARDYVGPDQFTFVANDGGSDSALATVTLKVEKGDASPVPTNAAVVTPQDTAKTITLTGTDPDGDALTAAVVRGPFHGTLSGTGSTRTYTPAAGYSGPDKVEFTVTDGKVVSAVGTVEITVTRATPANRPPVAKNRSVETVKDAPVSFQLTADDPDGDALNYILVKGSGPAHGALTGAGNNLTYTPAAGYVGGDSFQFTVSDGKAGSNVATVSITVKAPNAAPTANSRTVTTPKDTKVDFQLSGSDPEGVALNYILIKDSGPAHGTLTGAAPNLSYQPAAGYVGPDSFSFKVNDGSSDSNVAVVSITVTAPAPPANRAPTAKDKSVTTAKDTKVSFQLEASDPDGNALNYILIKDSGPSHGTLTGAGPNLDYLPNPGYVGADSFKFKVNDGHLDSNVATVSITVAAPAPAPVPVNHAPVAEGYTARTAVNTPVKVPLFGSDQDGDKLSFLLGPTAALYIASHGTVSGTVPNLVYTPNKGFTGRDSFSFAVSDGRLVSSPSVINIDVVAPTAPPVAYGQTVRTRRNLPVSIHLDAASASGSALTYAITKAPRHGFLIQKNDHLLYVPRGRFIGTDSFRFRVQDAGGRTSNEATVVVKVKKRR